MSLLLNVPFSEKNEVKKLGAKWNPTLKSWYVESKRDYYKFVKWILNSRDKVNILCDKIYLLQRERICYKCGRTTPVYAIAFSDYFTVYDMSKCESATVPIEYYDETLTISSIPEVPTDIEKILSLHFNCYMDHSKTAKRNYIANHCCYCKALQGNFELFQEWDAPFDIDNLHDDISSNKSSLRIFKIIVNHDIITDLEIIIEDEEMVIEEIIESLDS